MISTWQRDEGRLTLDCPTLSELHALVERARQGPLLIRLEDRLDEGTTLCLRFQRGQEWTETGARVQQVFRSGADLWGTVFELESIDRLQREKAAAKVERDSTVDAVGSKAGDAAALGESPQLAAESVGDHERAGEPEAAEAETTEPEASVSVTARRDTSEMRGVSAQFDIKRLNPNQKMRLASQAGRQERAVLLRDTSQQVILALLANPRIEIKEVVEIAKNPRAAQIVLTRIANDPRFNASGDIRLALVRNPMTPTPIAVRIIDTLPASEIRPLAKSQSLKEPVRKAALRVVLRG